MNIKEFLLKVKIDINDISDQRANNLLAELSRFNIIIDYNKDITDATDDELYNIGRNIILSENKNTPFFNTEIIDEMKKLIEKYSTE
jgi:hypothetical protein